jgi:conjugal transfer mating pair stabilization protein TraG
MPNVSGGGGAGSVEADYSQHSGSIDDMTHNAGIKDNVGHTVDTMVSQNKEAHRESQQGIKQQEERSKNSRPIWKPTTKQQEIILQVNIIKKLIVRELR